MAIAFTTCPKCKSLILDDAAECHSCHLVLDSERLIRRESLPSDSAVNEDMEHCPKCGAECRSGLVRCWSCSAFLRAEIQDAYQRKVEAHGLYPSDLQDGEAAAMSFGSGTAEDTSAESESASDAAFAEAYRTGNRERTAVFRGGEQFLDSGDELDFEVSDDAPFSQGQDYAPVPMGVEADDDYEISSDLLSDAPEVADTVASSSLPSAETYALGPIPATDSSNVEEPPLPISLQAQEPAAPEEPPLPPPDPSIKAAEELISIVQTEQAEIARGRKVIREKLGQFVVFCPMGCRILVHERHRGKTGKCPKCGSLFVVPLSRESTPATTSGSGSAGGTPTAAPPTNRYQHWIADVRLHAVTPAKLRIKADSQAGDFQAVDLAFSPDGMLMVTLVTSAGLFGSAEKKKPALREGVIAHLEQRGTTEGLPAAKSEVVGPEALRSLLLVQPAAEGTESLFSNVPIFGTNRVAVRLSKATPTGQQLYLSFSLSQYRAFVSGLGATGLGIDLRTPAEVPMADDVEQVACGISQLPVKSLRQLNYYQADPAFKLSLTGHRCAACGFTISEAARAKEQIGGANGKAIAKTNCPKCGQKMGSQPLYQLEAAPAAPTAPAPAAETPA